MINKQLDGSKPPPGFEWCKAPDSEEMTDERGMRYCRPEWGWCETAEPDARRQAEGNAAPYVKDVLAQVVEYLRAKAETRDRDDEAEDWHAQKEQDIANIIEREDWKDKPTGGSDD